VHKPTYFARLSCLLLATTSSLIAVEAAEPVDVESRDHALYSTVPFGSVPSNGFFFLNNTFGKGAFTNGIDYSSRLVARRASFPDHSMIDWSWPNSTSGSAFAYAYPEIIYGGTPWGNPYKTVGPWPQRIDQISKLLVAYDINLGGNANSYDVLLDMYVTASRDSTDGSYVAEISFFPHLLDPKSPTNSHQLSSVGRVSIERQGRQILVRPLDSRNGPRDVLNANVDLKEIIDNLVETGILSGREYLRGIEFGAEVQVPNAYNSAPRKGSLEVRKLSYTWR
jgi:hypothetical protein